MFGELLAENFERPFNKSHFRLGLLYVIIPHDFFEPARRTLDPTRIVVRAFHSHCSRTVNINRPCGVVVSAHASASERKPAPSQSPAPGFDEKYWSLPGFPSHSFESGGGAFLTVIFGQIFAYSAFNDSHFSSPGSLSGLIASTGHSGSHTPQSMHSSGWITSMFSPS
jgi:hypothetical protein